MEAEVRGYVCSTSSWLAVCKRQEVKKKSIGWAWKRASDSYVLAYPESREEEVI